MKRGALALSLVVIAGFSAVSPARAEHEERREEHREGHPKPRKPKHPPAKLQQKGPGQRRPPVQQHGQVRPQRPPQVRPGAQPQPRQPERESPAAGIGSGRAPSIERVRPAPTPRPESGANPQRASPQPMMPAPKMKPEPATPPTAQVPPVSTLPKPRPITDPDHFVRHWEPPPPPKTNAAGAALTATPVSRPPSPRHTAVFENQTVVTNIISNQQNELQPNRYYWHRDGDFDFVHAYRGGAHWYGFYVGPSYYWAQYHGGRWWWYDPGAQRYVYYGDGYWWWQNPVQPQTIYVYQNQAYVPYAAASGEPNNVVVSTAPAGPSVPRYRSDVDVPAYTEKPDPNRFAIVIGVEDYAGLPKAEFAARDAEAVRAHLEALGYPDRNVVLLTSSQAARGSIVKYVESWLPERVTDKSRVLVYFSGHGAPDPKTGAAYLMPWDGDAKYLANTGYPLKQLYASLNALPAKEVVLDSCFSGMGGRSVLVAGARPLVTNTDVGRGSTGKAVVFSATGADEITGTLPDQGHGLFTYYFLKGLNGDAGGSVDGVTVQGLFDYLTPNVEDAARRDNRDQTPQLFVPPDGQRKLLIKDLRQKAEESR